MNNFSISSTGIGDALQRSAASLNAANNSLDESIAMITAANAIAQDPDSVGSAMKVVAARIRGAKAELEEMGEDTDDLAESTSKLRSELMALTGVDIMLDDGETFKSTYQVLDEISTVWDSLSDVSQASVLETIAGKNRSSVVAGLISNFEEAREVIEACETSAGSAAEEQEKYLESIDGRLATLKATFQEVSNTAISSDWFKDGISGLTKMLDMVAKLVDTLGGIPTILATFAIDKGVGEVFSQLSKSYKTLTATQGFEGSIFKYLFGSSEDFSKQQALLDTAINATEEYYKLTADKGLTHENAVQELNANCEAWQSLNRATREQIKSAGNAEVAIDSLTVSIQTQSVAATLCQKATATLKASLKNIGGMFASWVLVEAVSYIVNAIQDWLHKEEKLKKEHEEYIQKQKELLETQKEYLEQIRDIASEYEELGKIVNKTDEQKQSLSDLQDQLIEKFGAEANAIDLVNGKYEEQIEKLKELDSTQAQKTYDASVKVVDGAKTKTQDNTNNILSLFGDNKKLEQSTSYAMSELSYILNEDYGLYSKNDDGTYTDNITGLTHSLVEVFEETISESIDEYKKDNAFIFYEQLLSDIDLLSQYGIHAHSEGIYLDSLNSKDKVSALQFLRDYVDKNTSVDAKQEDWFKSLISRISDLSTHYESEVSEYEKVALEQIENYLAFATTKDGVSYDDLVNTELLDWTSLHNFLLSYNDFLPEIIKEFSGDQEMLKEYLRENLYDSKINEYNSSSSLVNDYETFSEIIEAYKDKLDELKENVSEFDDYIDKIESGTLTSADKIALLQLYPELVGVDDLRQGLIDLRDEAINSLAKELQSLNIPDSLKGDVDELVETIRALSDLTLSEFSSLIEKQYDKEIDRVSDEISKLEELKSEEEEYYQEKIDKLKEANEEQERANELEEAYQELEKARTQKTLKVWRSGVGWTYETDKSAIKEAQENVDSLKQEIEIEELEDAKEAVTEKYDKQIDALEDYQSELEDFKKQYTDFVDSMSDQYDEQFLAEHNLTLNLKGEQEQRLADLKAYTEEAIAYTELTYAMSVANEALSSNFTNSALAGITAAGKSLGVGTATSVWAWENNPLSSLNSKLSTSSTTSKTNNNNIYNLSFGNVVANDPKSFMKEMANYTKTIKTKSIIK